MESDQEIPLSGGRLSTVVRVGNTVRRPTGRWTPAVHSLLRHLENAGYTGAPRALGIDDRGREILSYIPGTAAAGDTRPPYVWTHETLIGVAHLVRRYHDAVATFVPPVDAAWQFSDTGSREAEIICHNDIAPWNTVFQDGAPVALIDWDLASPGLRVWDVAFVLWHFVPLYEDEKCIRLGCLSSLDEKARRLRCFCDAYGFPRTANVLAEVVQRQRRARERIRTLADRGHASGVRLWQSGIGQAILREVAFVERNALALARYLTETP
jgi:hypothetical protein